jgi:hypothetical protein
MPEEIARKQLAEFHRPALRRREIFRPAAINPKKADVIAC